MLLLNLGELWQACVFLYLTTLGVQRLFVTAVCNCGHLWVRQSSLCFLCTVWLKGKSLPCSSITFHCLSSLQIAVILSLIDSVFSVNGYEIYTNMIVRLERSCCGLQRKWFHDLERGEKRKETSVYSQPYLWGSTHLMSDSYVVFHNSQLGRN